MEKEEELYTHRERGKKEKKKRRGKSPISHAKHISPLFQLLSLSLSLSLSVGGAAESSSRAFPSPSLFRERSRRRRGPPERTNANPVQRENPTLAGSVYFGFWGRDRGKNCGFLLQRRENQKDGDGLFPVPLLSMCTITRTNHSAPFQYLPDRSARARGKIDPATCAERVMARASSACGGVSGFHLSVSLSLSLSLSLSFPHFHAPSSSSQCSEFILLPLCLRCCCCSAGRLGNPESAASLA